MNVSDDPIELPSVLQKETLFEESIVKIRRDRLQINQHPPYSYYTLVTPPSAVAILAITDRGEFVINQEYRHPTGQVLLGCPGGYMDEHEEPVEAAKRELLEETGATAASFEVIGSAYPYPGFSGQKTIYIRALSAAFTKKPTPESSEIIHPILLDPTSLAERIERGDSLDGILCTALFFHHQFRQ